jgi:peptidoglycan/LPS O-acetylase OafA/YrhL
VPASQPSSPRSPGLDTLRALAIALVFMYHYRVFVSREDTFGWLSVVGWVGVDLFFVLSGYLIGRQLFMPLVRGDTPSLPNFYARRLLRTLPNYLVVVALYFLFPAVMGGREPPPLWRFLTFTQNWQLPPGTAFSHAWSLCIEEQFYLVLPLVVVLGTRFVGSVRAGWWLLGALVLTGIAARSWLWTRYGREAGGAIAGYHPNIYYATLCRFDEFLPGVAIAMLQSFHPQAWQRVMQRGRSVLAIGLVACAVTTWALLTQYEIEGYGYGYVMTGFGYSLVAMSFALLVLAALSPRTWLSRLNVPGAAALAAWSYAIYLSHKAVANILQHQLALHGHDAKSWWAVLLITLASVAAGWALYRLVETPFMRLRDHRFPVKTSRAAIPVAPDSRPLSPR